MDKSMKRQLVHGILSLVIGLVATWLINYLVNKIIGDNDETQQQVA